MDDEKEKHEGATVAMGRALTFEDELQSMRDMLSGETMRAEVRRKLAVQLTAMLKARDADMTVFHRQNFVHKRDPNRDAELEVLDIILHVTHGLDAAAKKRIGDYISSRLDDATTEKRETEIRRFFEGLQMAGDL